MPSGLLTTPKPTGAVTRLIGLTTARSLLLTSLEKNTSPNPCRDPPPLPELMADPAPNRAAITQPAPRGLFPFTPPAEENTHSRAAVRTMDQPFTIINDARSLADACDELQQAETTGLDCETTDL